jgi:hypothetical protein
MESTQQLIGSAMKPAKKFIKDQLKKTSKKVIDIRKETGINVAKRRKNNEIKKQNQGVKSLELQKDTVQK